MKVVNKELLVDYWEAEHRVKEPLKSWLNEVEHADWDKPTDIKEKYRSASILKKGRVVFNIKGNKYRLVVKIYYAKNVVDVRFIGTHEEYDRIDAGEV